MGTSLYYKKSTDIDRKSTKLKQHARKFTNENMIFFSARDFRGGMIMACKKRRVLIPTRLDVCPRPHRDEGINSQQGTNSEYTSLSLTRQTIKDALNGFFGERSVGDF